MGLTIQPCDFMTKVWEIYNLNLVLTIIFSLSKRTLQPIFPLTIVWEHISLDFVIMVRKHIYDLIFKNNYNEWHKSEHVFVCHPKHDTQIERTNWSS